MRDISIPAFCLFLSLKFCLSFSQAPSDSPTELKPDITQLYVDPAEPVVMVNLPLYNDDSWTFNFAFKTEQQEKQTIFSEADSRLDKIVWIGTNADNENIGPREVLRNDPTADHNATFTIQKNEIQGLNKIEIKCHYILNKQSAQTKSYTLPLSTKEVPKIVEFDSEKGLYYDELSSGLVRLNIKSSVDGVTISSLKVGTSNALTTGSQFAILEDDNIILSRIEKTLNLKLQDGNNVNPGENYYLFGEFKMNGEEWAKWEGERIRAYKRGACFVKNIVPNDIQGDQESIVLVETVGVYNELTMKYSEDRANLVGDPVSGDKYKWKFTIPADFPVGNKTVKFEGVGNQQDCQITDQTTLALNKKSNTWKSFEYKVDGTSKDYQVNVELESESSSVELLLGEIEDKLPLRIAGGSTSGSGPKTSTKWTKNFNMGEASFRDIASELVSKDPSTNVSTLKLKVKIDGKVIPQEVIAPAYVIDVSKLTKDTKKVDIKKAIKEAGFEENIDEIAKAIQDELKKPKDGTDQEKRNWDNVWSSIVKLAPKLFTLLLI